MQNHDVVNVMGGIGLMGILMRIGVVRFEIFFSLPSAFLKPIDDTGVPVSLPSCAPLVFVPKPFMPT